jgi:predicted ATPase/class 3 adenylate cyclase
MGDVRLVPVLFTDIEGSTQAWEDDPGEMSAVLAEHDRLMREAIAAQGGEVFSTAGDSFAARFPAALAALQAAVDAQIAAGHLAVKGHPVRARMAVHAGEVEKRDGGWFGPALNQCARLRDVAHGGQVLVSAVAEQLVADRLPDAISLENLGQHRLRDLSRPQRVFGVHHPDLDAGFPPLRSLGATNLPVQVNSFVGRVQELTELQRLICNSRLVTVVGAGGCGKSRLAVHVAAEMSGEFPDGMWLIELAALTNPGLLAATVAAAVGVGQQPGRDVVESLVGFLRSRKLLLVVDNCEHLIESAADLIRDVLRSTAEVRVVTTSREPLHIRGETVFHLAPLPIPAPGDDQNGVLSSDGVRLFVERAEMANPQFRLTQDNGETLAGICTRLDGIPLALELAASMTRLLPLDLINQRLGDRFRLLTGETRDDLDHHRTLEAAIDWSYGLLTPDQQTFFERIAVFAAPFSMEAAEAVCPDDDTLKTIVQLADRSLLEIEETPPGVRYRMLETIRAFATTRLQEQPDEARQALHQRHYRYCLTLAEQATEGPLSADAPPEWLPQLDAVTPDLRQALAWAIETGRDQCAVDLAGALGWYWHVRGRTEAGHWFQQVPLHSADTTVRSRTSSMRWAAHHLAGAGGADAPDISMARQLAEESLRLARRIGDPSLISASLGVLGHIGFAIGDPQTVQVLEEGLTVAQQAGDPWRQVMCRNLLAHHLDQEGHIHRRTQLIDQARALWEENLHTARRLSDDRMMGLTLGFLSRAAQWFHDLDEAGRLAEESLDISRRLDDHSVINNALIYLANTAYLKGDYETAKTLIRQAVDVTWRATGEEGIDHEWGLGIVAYAQGDYRLANEHFYRFFRAASSVLPSPVTGLSMFYLRRAIWGFGRVLAREGSLRQASVLFAAIEAAEQALPPWIDQVREPADYQRCLDLIRTGLQPEMLREAHERGAAMTLGEAAEYALRFLERSKAD